MPEEVVVCDEPEDCHSPLLPSFQRCSFALISEQSTLVFDPKDDITPLEAVWASMVMMLSPSSSEGRRKTLAFIAAKCPGVARHFREV